MDFDVQVWKKWIIQLPYLVFFLVVWVISFILGIGVTVYPHEYGHYFFAYLGNKNAIVSITFNQLKILKDLLNGIKPDVSDLGHVNYNGLVPDVFKGVWIDFVYVGGLVFSLLFLILLIYTKKALNKSKNPLLKWLNYKIVLPFYFGALTLTSMGWLSDGEAWWGAYHGLGYLGVLMVYITAVIILVRGVQFYKNQWIENKIF